MSWSLSLIGNPENICKELDEQSKILTGKSKEEFDESLPYIQGLVNQNFNTQYPVVLHVEGNGHAYDGYSNCSISIKSLGGKIV